MKRLSLLLIAVVCTLVSGCVKYRVTLNSGESFTVLGKPKYDEANGVYTYRSGGEKRSIPAGRVTSIEPASDSPENKFQSSGH